MFAVSDPLHPELDVFFYWLIGESEKGPFRILQFDAKATYSRKNLHGKLFLKVPQLRNAHA